MGSPEVVPSSHLEDLLSHLAVVHLETHLEVGHLKNHLEDHLENHLSGPQVGLLEGVLTDALTQMGSLDALREEDLRSSLTAGQSAPLPP